MTTDIALPLGEHARGTSSDRIVLDAEQVRTALGWAMQTPAYVLSAQAERDALGLDTDPLLRAMLAEAAAFARAHGLGSEKPVPRTTVTHTERVLPTIQTDVDGDRFLDGGAYRFTCDEATGDVIVSVKERMDEHEFAAIAAPFGDDARRFAQAITAPVESSWNRVAS